MDGLLTAMLGIDKQTRKFSSSQGAAMLATHFADALGASESPEAELTAGLASWPGAGPAGLEPPQPMVRAR